MTVAETSQRVSSSFFQSLPAAPLTPNLQRFITALGQLQLPLLRRGKAPGRKGGRGRRAVPRARGAHLNPPAPPHTLAATPSPSAAVPPQTLRDPGAAAEVGAGVTAPRGVDRGAAGAGRRQAASTKGGSGGPRDASAAVPVGETEEHAAAAVAAPLLVHLQPHLRSISVLLQRLTNLPPWDIRRRGVRSPATLPVS